jgi:hypothetical protein
MSYLSFRARLISYLSFRARLISYLSTSPPRSTTIPLLGLRQRRGTLVAFSRNPLTFSSTIPFCHWVSLGEHACAIPYGEARWIRTVALRRTRVDG